MKFVGQKATWDVCCKYRSAVLYMGHLHCPTLSSHYGITGKILLQHLNQKDNLRDLTSFPDAEHLQTPMLTPRFIVYEGVTGWPLPVVTPHLTSMKKQKMHTSIVVVWMQWSTVFMLACQSLIT